MSRKCPTPWKRAYESKAQAQRVLDAIVRRQGSASGWAQSVYQCSCRKWHYGGLRKHRFAPRGRIKR